ncbi:hypothetical protein LTR35_000442 [Friedmanniomyces endolithicus]|uniref:Uncharacterized protein n=1 Tax=Friedmanniomyces endolithicus TaxID=329885 RepID=A0AAN6JC14_9PEZI|nr:hypothetical protein LTS00_009284 [Friedmanniomyces endolithicus]KAK0293835.1 hypothetical protein LTR35_000442 [Friedmanniomyces endolithicus]KAK0324349.1 hypothetical protein LTR82_004788 [Friedmanniomyces endolithicus]KAK0991698.1 hypothetical protein LTR54_011618 [Friedmanniomyces endolithicus]
MSAPAKRVEEMTPEERIRSLKEFGEAKKYVRPGEDGTLPQGPGAMQALVFGGPMRDGPEYSTPLPPPSYETATGEGMRASGSKSGGPVRRWLEKRREKREGEKAKRIEGEK